MKVHGTITAITSEPRSTKYGTRNVHYVHVNGERYQLGFGKVDVKVGDVVDFDEGDKGYGPEVVKGSIVVLAGAVAVPTGSVIAVAPATPAVGDIPFAAPKSGKQSGIFPIPALSGERAILRQNASTQARELYLALTLTPQPDLDKAVLEIIRIARKFEAYTAGDLDMDAAKAEMEKK